MGPVSLSRLYRYVGPPEIAERCQGEALGHPVRSFEELQQALRALGGQGTLTCTYVVDHRRVLRLADRSSEHVACAGGGPVFAAGEITVSSRGEVIDVSNQSTGFCPEPSAWSALVEVLEQAGLHHPIEWSAAFDFRRCPSCDARSIVKDDVFECAECGGELPRQWNFSRVMCRRARVTLGREWTVDVIEEPASANQDRMALRVDGDALVLALADGAGGSAGGGQAADRATDVLSGWRAGDPSVLLSSLDAALSASGGECAAVFARVTGDDVAGASVGDSQCCVRDGSGWRELTERQVRKPLLGSGRAIATSFQARSIERLVLASDGLWKYAPWPRLCAMLDADAASLPWDLVDSARLPSGNLQDDLCVVLLRPASDP